MKTLRSAKRQRPDRVIGPFGFRVPDDDLLSHGQSVLSSARRRFTVLFGMGRGGSSGLWSSGVGSYQLSAISIQQQRAQGTRVADTARGS